MGLTSSIELVAVDPTVSLMIRADNVFKIRSATASDLMLSRLSEVIQSGWPAERADTDELVRPFYSFRDELVVHDGLVYKGQRLVIPKSLRRKMLEIAHGLTKTAQRSFHTYMTPMSNFQRLPPQ